MANLLHLETSPYLLQHKDNPVHWRSWSKQALEDAKQQDKPILLSVGYAACHWCHVMAHESFEDVDTAKVMNELFINIKVDREERPDIDQIYMEALTRLGEQGGWPLTMFLTSHGEPFWGGTYFPNEAKYGRPAFVDVLTEIARAYRETPDKIDSNKTRLLKALAPKPGNKTRTAFGPKALDDIAAGFLPLFDKTNGGVSGAPKFPQFPVLEFLWRAAARTSRDDFKQAVTTTLTHICQGGIYDHLIGGMARYSVDTLWLAPHFEKMLYDNALLIKLLTLAWQDTQDPLFKIRIEETIHWLNVEMTSAQGGFAASLDADSEGVEGKFYVWTQAEIEEVLGSSRAKQFAEIYDVSSQGNWEGLNILNRLGALKAGSDKLEQALATDRTKLREHRNQRIRPGLDDKILADWNGLMISAMANAARTFTRPDWLKTAQTCFHFINTEMTRDGLLVHSYRAGQARHNATLEDYANMIEAALTLYEITAQKSYLETAQNWANKAHSAYWDHADGGYFFTADYADDILIRMKAVRDDATPNANATMMANLTKLHFITGEKSYLQTAETLFQTFAEHALSNGFYHATFFNAFELLAASTQIVMITSDEQNQTTEGFLNEIYRLSIPARIISHHTDTSSLAPDHPAHGKMALEGKPTLYICRGTTCSLPITQAHDIANHL